MLSKFPTLLFKELIKGKCSKNGIKLKEISPSYTSIIGLYKYSKRDNLSTAHHSRSKDLSAALVIGRRGLGLKEREVVCFRKLGKTIALTANSLSLSAEHGKNKKGKSKNYSNFWYKISKDINLSKTLTGTLKVKFEKAGHLIFY